MDKYTVGEQARLRSLACTRADSVDPTGSRSEGLRHDRQGEQAAGQRGSGVRPDPERASLAGVRSEHPDDRSASGEPMISTTHASEPEPRATRAGGGRVARANVRGGGVVPGRPALVPTNRVLPARACAVVRSVQFSAFRNAPVLSTCVLDGTSVLYPKARAVTTTDFPRETYVLRPRLSSSLPNSLALNLEARR